MDLPIAPSPRSTVDAVGPFPADVEVLRNAYAALMRRLNRTPTAEEFEGQLIRRGLLVGGAAFWEKIGAAEHAGLRFPLLTESLLIASAKALRIEISGMLPVDSLKQSLHDRAGIEIGAGALWRMFKRPGLRDVLAAEGIAIERPLTADGEALSAILLRFEQQYRNVSRELRKRGISRAPAPSELHAALRASGETICDSRFEALCDRFESSNPKKRELYRKGGMYYRDMVESTYHRLRNKGRAPITYPELRDEIFRRFEVRFNPHTTVHKANADRKRLGLPPLAVVGSRGSRPPRTERSELAAIVARFHAERGEAPRAVDIKLRWLRDHPGQPLHLSTIRKAITKLRAAGASEIHLRDARKATDEQIVEAAVAARDYLGRNPMLSHVYETMRLRSPTATLGKDGLKVALKRVAESSAANAALVETSQKGIPGAVAPRETFLAVAANPFLADFATYLRPFDLKPENRALAAQHGIVLRQPDLQMQDSPLGHALSLETSPNGHAIEHARALLDRIRVPGACPHLRTLTLAKNEAGEHFFSTAELTGLLRFIHGRGLQFLNLKEEPAQAVRAALSALLGYDAKIHERANPRFYLEPLLTASAAGGHVRKQGYSTHYTVLGMLDEIVKLTVDTRWGLPSERLVPKLDDIAEPGAADDGAPSLEGESFPALRTRR